MATLSSRINTVTSNLKTAKKDLKTAVVNKGGTISASSPTFAQIIAGINSISGAKIQYKNYNVLSNSIKELTYSPVKSTITSSSISSEEYFIKGHYKLTTDYIYGSYGYGLPFIKDNYTHILWYSVLESNSDSDYKTLTFGVDRANFLDGTAVSTLMTSPSVSVAYYCYFSYLPKVLGESYFLLFRQYYKDESYIKLLNVLTSTLSDVSTISSNSFRSLQMWPVLDEEIGIIYMANRGEVFKFDIETATFSSLRGVSYNGGNNSNYCNDIPSIMPRSSSTSQKKILWSQYEVTTSNAIFQKGMFVYNITTNTVSNLYSALAESFHTLFYDNYPNFGGFVQEWDSSGALCFPFIYLLKDYEIVPSLISLKFNISSSAYEPIKPYTNYSNLSSSTLMPVRSRYCDWFAGYKKTEHFIEYAINKGKNDDYLGELLPNNWNWCYYKKMITYCQLPVFKNATYKFNLPIVIHENYKIVKEVVANTSYKLTNVNRETQIAVNLFAIDESSITDTLVLNGTITLPS